MSNKLERTVSVLGMGHLGLPLAVTFALSKFKVFGIDIDESKVNLLKESKSPFEESHLQETLDKEIVKNNFFPTTDFKSSIKKSIASFILVNTPSTTDGSYNTVFVEKVAQSIAEILKEITFFHVVVLVSTVSPGDSLSRIVPLLEKISGKKRGKAFGFVHNPEFIALGSVIKDMLNPDFRVIGEEDEKSGNIIEEIYKNVSDAPIVRMSVNNAELVKIALNCFLTIKISFANTIGEICQKLEGGNSGLVAKTLGLDKRISPYFLNAGMGYGGPCFPRDDKALIALAEKLDAQAFLSEASSKVNMRQVELALIRIRAVSRVKTILVLGMAYKPNVPYIGESQAFEITRILSEDNSYKLTVYDPQAMTEAKKILGNRVIYAISVKEALENKFDLILILTPWKEFLDMDFENQHLINFWKS
ncbi:MAG: UDP-glucose 6-dehydrogenase TuaD [Candidatus Heimdallarchaeota archaeon LC_3]|nr:MAG: UDP-glucose 6-dehydrogenase TuaD [Candidatus Heimdallarchaeota archaeon LC_3]